MADFRRPWGVPLTRKDIPLLERLRRFFIVQDAPDRYNAQLKSELSKFKIQCMRGGKSGPQSGVSAVPCECQCKAQLLEMGFAEEAVDQVLAKPLKPCTLETLKNRKHPYESETLYPNPLENFES